MDLNCLPLTKKYFKVKHVMWLSLVSLLGLFGPVACLKSSRESTALVQGSGVNSKDLERLLTQTRAPLQKVQERLLGEFPPAQFSYVFAGRSPTPLYAALAHLPHAITVPFSDLRSGDIISLERAKGTTFELQKALDHMDVYISPLVDLMIAKKAPNSIVVIDFTATGFSLGRVMNLLELSLKRRSKNEEKFRRWVVQENKGLPKIHYFAMKPYSIEEQLHANILKQKQNPIPAKAGKIETLVAKPGEVLGSEPLTLDTQDYAKIFSSQPTPTWDGYQMDLSESADLEPLLKGLINTLFDPYAPFGSWNVSTSALEAKVKPMSQGFLELKKALGPRRFNLPCLAPRVQ